MDPKTQAAISKMDNALRTFIPPADGKKTSNADIRKAKGIEDKLLETPVRIWTGGPGSIQEKLILPNKSKGIRPRADGSYLFTTETQLAVAQRALKNRWWEDSVPDDKPSLRCEGCNWTCRSYEAMNWHQNYCHGRPQGTN